MPEANGSTQWQLFKRFTAVYPKRQDVARAWLEWQAIRPRPDEALLARMLQTLAWQVRDPQWQQDGGRYVPWMRNWLRHRRWEDEPFEPPSALAVSPPKPRTKAEAISQQNAATLAKVLARQRGERE